MVQTALALSASIFRPSFTLKSQKCESCCFFPCFLSERLQPGVQRQYQRNKTAASVFSRHIPTEQAGHSVGEGPGTLGKWNHPEWDAAQNLIWREPGPLDGLIPWLNAPPLVSFYRFLRDTISEEERLLCREVLGIKPPAGIKLLSYPQQPIS